MSNVDAPQYRSQVLAALTMTLGAGLIVGAAVSVALFNTAGITLLGTTVLLASNPFFIGVIAGAVGVGVVIFAIAVSVLIKSQTTTRPVKYSPQALPESRSTGSANPSKQVKTPSKLPFAVKVLLRVIFPPLLIWDGLQLLTRVFTHPAQAKKMPTFKFRPTTMIEKLDKDQDHLFDEALFNE